MRKQTTKNKHTMPYKDLHFTHQMKTGLKILQLFSVQ